MNVTGISAAKKQKNLMLISSKVHMLLHFKLLFINKPCEHGKDKLGLLCLLA